MLGYVEDQRWKQTDPVPAWKAPHSVQMTLVAEFFKLSQALRVSGLLTLISILGIKPPKLFSHVMRV